MHQNAHVRPKLRAAELCARAVGRARAARAPYEEKKTAGFPTAQNTLARTSLNSEVARMVNVTNNTSAEIRLLWLNYDGARFLSAGSCSVFDVGVHARPGPARHGLVALVGSPARLACKAVKPVRRGTHQGLPAGAC